MFTYFVPFFIVNTDVIKRSGYIKVSESNEAYAVTTAHKKLAKLFPNYQRTILPQQLVEY